MKLSLTTTARGTASGILLTLLLAVPSQLLAVAHILDIHQPLGDYDLRQGVVEPSAAQTALADALGATARWNKFGTPASLISHGGFLGSGSSAEPEQAARQWIEANRELFRLSLADAQGLELYLDTALVDSDAHVVIFRQRFGDLPPTLDGMIAIGVVDGSIAYVSSSRGIS